jgi:DNA repair exonuclease SbcCD ATPase subunit
MGSDASEVCTRPLLWQKTGFKLHMVSEAEDFLIEQLRAYGISPEELEALIRGKEASEDDAARQGGEGAQTPAPGAFDDLTGAAGEEDEQSVADRLRDHASRLEANEMRDQALADAQEAAAEIRASAVKLVSEKLQAAEDEVMAMRMQAADDVARLRKETARAMLARLQDAEREAENLRQTAHDESAAFWESAAREFADAHQQITRMRAELSSLIASVDEAVSALESAAGSIAALSARQVESRKQRP